MVVAREYGMSHSTICCHAYKHDSIETKRQSRCKIGLTAPTLRSGNYAPRIKIEKYVYKDLLFESAEHSTLESMIVSYADKYDAYGEAVHEIFAGNHYFTTHVINEYGKIPTPRILRFIF